MVAKRRRRVAERVWGIIPDHTGRDGEGCGGM